MVVIILMEAKAVKELDPNVVQQLGYLINFRQAMPGCYFNQMSSIDLMVKIEY